MGLFGGIKSVLTSASGEDVTGTITGIRVWEQSDGESSTKTHHEFRVELPDTTVLGIRQEPGAHVRLGAQVTIKHSGKSGVINWDSGTYNWKMVKPPDRGISDDRDGIKGARKRWVPVRVTIEGRVERPVAFGLARRIDLEVTVQDGGTRRAFAKNSKVPRYATHLAAVGTTVPAYTKQGGGDVVVDWAAAALAEPGVNTPDGDLYGSGRELGSGSLGSGLLDPGKPTAAPAAPKLPFGIKVKGVTDLEAPTPISDADPVPWAMFIAVEKGIIRDRVPPAEYETYAETHGVPAGGWASAKATWMSRIMTDWKVGAEYGKAMSEK